MPNNSSEYWKQISFGNLIDQYGGSRVPLEKQVITPFFVEEDTSRGHIELRFVEGKFNVLAPDLGIGLLYDSKGNLETIGVDLINYCMNLDEEDFESEEGEILMEMIGKMIENNDHFYIDIELKDNSLAFASINEYSKEKKILAYIENIDFSLSSLAKVDYNGFTLLLGLCNDDDEFRFGVGAVDEIDSDAKMSTNMLITKILSDCNYKTFLESKAEDRWERLAKRIFFRLD